MKRPSAVHEDYTRDEPVKLGSNRAFGLVFAGFFGLLGIAGLWRSHHLRIWALALSVLFLVAALVVPNVLAPLNRVWARIGAALHLVTSPVILGLMYAVAIVPVGLLMRWRGYDPMQRRFDPSLSSYWIARRPPGPSPESVTRQF